MANFQDLIPHWSLTFHSNRLHHHRGLGLSIPKWYDTCIFVKKWLHNRPKPVCGQNFDKTSGGYLGHLKPFFGATKGIDGCPLMGTEGF